MSKLSYTWYPKDWSTSEAVFELTLSERGLYRELIDMAMLNDNTTEVNYKVWVRKFAISKEDLDIIIENLNRLGLLYFKDEIIFIPSCEPRLNLSRGGRSGGKKSKPVEASLTNLEKALTKASSKASSKPKEKKVNIKESKVKESEVNVVYKSHGHLSITLEYFNKLVDVYGRAKSDEYIDRVCNYSKNSKYTSLYLTSLSWLKKDYGVNGTDNDINLPTLSKLVAGVSLQVPAEKERLIKKGYTEDEILKAAGL